MTRVQRSATSWRRAAEVPASVLIVDDNAANLVALKATLAPLGYRIVQATSGEDALKHLLQEDFAVILLDVQMPGMDGFEAASAIKAHPRTTDIPIMTDDLVHADDVAQLRRRWTEHTKALAPFDIECRLRRADGAHRWHLLKVVSERPVFGRISRHRVSRASHAAQRHSWLGPNARRRNAGSEDPVEPTELLSIVATLAGSV